MTTPVQERFYDITTTDGRTLSAYLTSGQAVGLGDPETVISAFADDNTGAMTEVAVALGDITSIKEVELILEEDGPVTQPAG